MNLIKIFLTIWILAFSTGQALGQIIGIGTTKRGATSQVSASIAKVVSQHAGIQMRTHPMAGTQKYIPAVNAGSLEFGVANIMQTNWAIKGTGLSKGHPNRNIRMVATLMPFRVGLVVTLDSGIRKVSDLRGKRIPSGFRAAPLFARMMAGFLANGKLSYNDVKNVPVSGLRQHWDLLSERKVDAVIAAAGTGYLKLMDKKLGGIRFIPLDPSPGALARMQAILPKTSIQTVHPAKPLTGMLAPTSLMFFDYTLFAGKNVSEDTAYRVTKAVFENTGALRDSSPLWKLFKSKKMSKDQGLKYHPGAVRFYKERGIWNR